MNTLSHLSIPSPSVSRLGRSFTLTASLLRRYLWLWPLIAGVLLAVLAYWLHTVVEQSLKKNMAGQLKTILNADVAALKIWSNERKADAETVAQNEKIAEASRALIDMAKNNASDRELLDSPRIEELRTLLKPHLEKNKYNGFVISDSKMRIVASARDELIGKKDLPGYTDFLPKVIAGRSTLSHPFPSVVIIPDEDGLMRAGVPTMFAAAPIRDTQGNVLGVIALRIRPEFEFTQILNIGQSGETGETYAFDKSGLLLSKSRFESELKRIGLIPDTKASHSILNVEIKDPQVDLTQGKRPSVGRSEQQLTRMAADAVTGKSGEDVDGYRGYRGVWVIGAWTWLPDYDFGIVTEIDRAEAYRPLVILRFALWGLFGLLAVASVAIFVFTLIVARLEIAARKAAVDAKKIGQYLLEDKIGSGGMGVVYRGRHAMLRRPTAIKLLNLEKTSEQAITRFEREVDLTSQLTHPNTVSIFDYGRTPEGIFYYAMEYLDGLDLDSLVKRFGPLPEGRVASILMQICGSLGEAHTLGLVHRDVKPANIFLTERGGIPDFVKVLDFGLVKAIDSERQSLMTAAGTFVGTPQYMSPEAIEHADQIDARSDIYSLGAVGYFLLTGEGLFSGNSVIEICNQQISREPERPSIRLKRPISLPFEELIVQCLAKRPEERPQSVKELRASLSGIPNTTWTTMQAEAWWRQYRGTNAPTIAVPPTKSINPLETILFDDGKG